MFGVSVLLPHPLLHPVGGTDKNVSSILMTNDLFYSMGSLRNDDGYDYCNATKQ